MHRESTMHQVISPLCCVYPCGYLDPPRTVPAGVLLTLGSVTQLLSLNLFAHSTEKDILVLECFNVRFIHLHLNLRTEHTISCLAPNPTTGININILVLWTPELLYQERFISLFFRM